MFLIIIYSISYKGLQKCIYKYPLITSGEVIRYLSKYIFVKSLQKLIQGIQSKMIETGHCGIRANL